MLRVPKESGGHTYRIIDGDLSGKASVNGVIINDKEKVSSWELSPGDYITLAPNAKLQYLLE
jgi:pSer/pThr/pTyr-binding forkhead associated (FHA) protein